MKARRKWAANNPERIKATWKRCVEERKVWFDKLKTNYCCSVCGEKDPQCLDFHHKESRDKKYNIAYMSVRGYSEEKIITEIAKCIVFCANCHRKHHVLKKPANR